MAEERKLEPEALLRKEHDRATQACAISESKYTMVVHNVCTVS